MLEIITTQTNIYANQYKRLNPPAFGKKIRIVISILQLSGCFKVSYQDLYWSAWLDNNNKSVSKAILRKRFREIFCSLHIRDNTNIEDDHFYKVRLLFDILNTNFKSFVPANNFNVNESMTSYHGKHNAKQFIMENPYDLGLHFGVYAFQVDTFFIQNHTVKKIPTCQK